MSFGVVADGMAAFVDFLRQRRTSADKLPNQKKRSLGLMPFKQIQKFWRDGWIWPIIKRDRQR